jgi:hypothetical protein
LSSKIFLIFIFFIVSCGVKKYPVAPATDKNTFVKSFMNTDISGQGLPKKEETKKKKRIKEQSQDQ